MKFSIRRLAVFASLLALLSPVHIKGAEIDITLRNLEKADGDWKRVTKKESWKPAETAVVICDMWDYHHCRNATMRVGEIAPAMNKLVSRLRDQGVFVIHAPSSCLDFYKDHPSRKRAEAAPVAANLPKDITTWCKVIPGEEMEHYPIDQSDGGEDDDLDIHQKWADHLSSLGRNPKSPWKRQIDLIQIDSDRDIISDQGDEIWNAMEERGIGNVLLVGVHTNMCVLGRPFGLRQMAQNGKNVALIRDMTDTMYNPEMPPYVSHYRGTELIIEHIEKYIAPTLTSDQLTGGEEFRFKWNVPTKVVMAIAEKGYNTANTLPVLAGRIWTKERGYQVTTIQGDPEKHTLPGLADALKDADILVLSVRRQALPADQLDAVRAHLAAGKSVMAIRTSSHGFDAKGKGPSGNAEWVGFDSEILGADYETHKGHDAVSTFTPVKVAVNHPVLKGVEFPFSSSGGFYFSSPLSKSANALIEGNLEGESPEPVAWTNIVGDSRIFYTCLGQEEELGMPAVQRLFRNAMDWLTILPSDIPGSEGY